MGTVSKGEGPGFEPGVSDTGGHALNQYELLQESGKAVGLLPGEKHWATPPHPHQRVGLGPL